MPLPYHVCCEMPAPRVYELDDGRFQLIDAMAIPPFLAGYRYLLVEQPLAEFLIEVGVERVRYEQAVLFNRAAAAEHSGHIRLHVNQSFTQDQIHDLSLEGPRLLVMNDEYYFVSPELKALLQASPFKYLNFGEGLRGFAGGAA